MMTGGRELLVHCVVEYGVPIDLDVILGAGSKVDKIQWTFVMPGTVSKVARAMVYQWATPLHCE